MSEESDEPKASDARLELVYAEAMRALEAQADHLAEVRGRAVAFVGTISGASGLIAAVSETHRGFDWLAAIAALCFAVALAAATWATLPAPFRLEHDPNAMLALYVDAGSDLDGMWRNLARKTREFWEVNERLFKAGLRAVDVQVGHRTVRRRLGPRYCLRVAALAFAAEVAAWIIYIRR
jgi:hypothetical protein